MFLFKKNKRTAPQRIVNSATFGAVLSLAALLSQHHLIFDLISHFRVQYIVLLIPAFFVAIAIKRTKSLLVICLALAIHSYAVTMSVLPTPVSSAFSGDAKGVDIKVLSSNLLLENTNYDAQLRLIETVEPDVISFQEYTYAWHEVLTKRLADYPYHMAKPTNGSFGIALFSKHPIVSGGVSLLMPNSTYIADVTIEVGEKKIRVIGVHPPPPSSKRMYTMRNDLLLSLAQLSANHDGALIMAGDFNATPWTSHFSNLLYDGKLRHARAGVGIRASWPANTIPFGIPIDHILVNKHLSVKSFSAAKINGSDHRAIWSQLTAF